MSVIEVTKEQALSGRIESFQDPETKAEFLWMHAEDCLRDCEHRCGGRELSVLEMMAVRHWWDEAWGAQADKLRSVKRAPLDLERLLVETSNHGGAPICLRYHGGGQWSAALELKEGVEVMFGDTPLQALNRALALPRKPRKSCRRVKPELRWLNYCSFCQKVIDGTENAIMAHPACWQQKEPK